MSNIRIIYNEYSPLIAAIKDSQFESFIYNEDLKIESNCLYFDFTFLTKDQKENLFAKIQKSQSEVFADLTCYSNKEFHQKHQALIGSFSSLFFNSSEKIECFCQDKKDEVIRVFSDLGVEPFWYDSYGVGFVYARVIAQIINEAYFALEENVANKKDIDRAMKYGVNYPGGPFEWSNNKEKIVVTLLEELSINDAKRYEIAKNLKEAK